MNKKEKIDKWLNEHSIEDYCNYCKYEDNCPHEVSNFGGEPFYPKCSDVDNIVEILDTDAILEEIKETKEKDILMQKYKEISKICEIQNVQAENVKDEYNCGLYNGLELALSILTGEEPQFKVLGSGRNLCFMEKLGANHRKDSN
jgi:hypothetical protein